MASVSGACGYEWWAGIAYSRGCTWTGGGSQAVPHVLALIQYAGAAYLLYLAWQLWHESVTIGVNNNQNLLNG